MTSARDIVYSILMDIDTNNTFSNVALAKALRQNQFAEKTDRAFISRIVEGVTEYRIRLDYVINQFSKTPVKKCRPGIRCILRMGVYQLIFMNSVPDRAACDEAVKLTRKHGFGKLSGFVNGVLRNISRGKDEIDYPSINNKVEYLSVIYSMPEWLCQMLIQDYSDSAENIIKASFDDRETSIRVNTLACSKEDMKKLLCEKNITFYDGNYDEDALLISGYDFIRRVPGFKQGFFAVQDESSMTAIREAQIKPGDFVIDVCSAPGGKTMTAAMFTGAKGHVSSRDISEDKLELINENIERLGLKNVDVEAGDATKKVSEFVGKAEVVIADVPCSGLGIIGRKNDIKYSVNEEQINSLYSLQKQILDNVCNYVKSGGTLLYSTCTINPRENKSQVNNFLDSHSEFYLVKDRQFVQGIDKCDGFYYAVIKKR